METETEHKKLQGPMKHQVDPTQYFRSYASIKKRILELRLRSKLESFRLLILQVLNELLKPVTEACAW